MKYMKPNTLMNIYYIYTLLFLLHLIVGFYQLVFMNLYWGSNREQNLWNYLDKTEKTFSSWIFMEFLLIISSFWQNLNIKIYVEK
jgi:hypothetical protein